MRVKVRIKLTKVSQDFTSPNAKKARVEDRPSVAQPLPPTSVPKKPGAGDTSNEIKHRTVMHWTLGKVADDKLV